MFKMCILYIIERNIMENIENVETSCFRFISKQKIHDGVIETYYDDNLYKVIFFPEKRGKLKDGLKSGENFFSKKRYEALIGELL